MEELNVSVKVGKSYKNRGWALSRSSTYELIPILPYEEECDIIVDGIKAKAHFNILPRIFYKKTEKELMSHLKMLSDNSVDRVELRLLLNKSKDISSESSSTNIYEERIKELENKLEINEKLIMDLQNENLSLVEDLTKYKSKSSDNFHSSDDEINMLNQEILELKDKNMELEIEFAKLLKKWNSLKKSLEVMKEFKSKFDKLDLE